MLQKRVRTRPARSAPTIRGSDAKFPAAKTRRRAAALLERVADKKTRPARTAITGAETRPPR